MRLLDTDILSELTKPAPNPVVSRRLLAATSLEARLPLVTRNVRHFENIEGLDLENWFEQT